MTFSVNSVGTDDIQAGFIRLVKSHFSLATTIIMGIPMKVRMGVAPMDM